MKNFIILLFMLIVFGCAVNPYYQFYNDQTNGADLATLPNVILTDKEPKIFKGNNIDSDFQNMCENGFLSIGYSSFNAGQIGSDKAISHAKNIKAEVVIVYSEYTNTVSGSIPLTLPNTETSTTTTSGNLWGVGSYDEISTTTTNKSETYNIPYNVNRYDYFASFWVKTKELTFGVHFRDLKTDERRLIGSNKGVVITAVVNNSPAFMADILANDVIKQIGDFEIINFDSCPKAIQKYKGKSVKIILWREGELISKEVKLND